MFVKKIILTWNFFYIGILKDLCEKKKGFISLGILRPGNMEGALFLTLATAN